MSSSTQPVIPPERQALVMYLSFVSAVAILASLRWEMVWSVPGVLFIIGAVFGAVLTVTAETRRGMSLARSFTRLLLGGVLTFAISYLIFWIIGGVVRGSGH